MKLRIACIAAVTAIAFPYAARAGLLRSEDAAVEFTATGPAGMKIVGTTADLTVEDDDKGMTIAVPLANLTTGIGLRDRHMKEKYLEVAEFPVADVRLPASAVRWPTPGADAVQDVSVVMTLHGQSRPVPLHYVARLDGTSVVVTGTTRIDIRDFNVAVPSYLGVTVRPNVDISVRFTVHQPPHAD